MKVDHVVWFTVQPPEEITMQINGAIVGGRHEKWGTYNALKYVRNAYIEWLSIEEADVAESSSHPLVVQLKHDLAAYGEGWGTLCISTEDLQALDQKLRKMGIQTSGVLDASRLTSSGAVKRWKMLFVDEEDLTDLPLPFFIQWEESEESRRRALQAEGAITDESDAERISECEFVTDNRKRTLERWCKILGVQADDEESLILNGVRLRFGENPDGRNRMLAVVTGQAD